MNPDEVVEVKNKLKDMVNHPAHYGGKDDPYEVIKVAEAWGFDTDAYLFQVLKYIRRNKNDQLEDLKKARFFLDRRIGLLEQTEAEHKAALEEETLPKYARYVSVYYNYEKNPFAAYSINAHAEWTVETLASIIATAVRKPTGTYTIGLSPHGNPIARTQTVDWMLRYCKEHDYYLQKV